MWHVTHGGGGWTFSQNFSSLALTAWDLWCVEDWVEKDDWLNETMNQWVSYEAVLRTALGTPGLIKIETIENYLKDINIKCIAFNIFSLLYIVRKYFKKITTTGKKLQHK